MVRPIPLIHLTRDQALSPIPLSIGLFVTVSLLVSLCAKHSRRFSEKQTSSTSEPNRASAKKLIKAISQKAMKYLAHAKKSVHRESDGGDENGVWQKAILMGDRCQPPEFSGVIYYDYSGNRISEMPKSPRPSSIMPSNNFTFPAHNY